MTMGTIRACQIGLNWLILLAPVTQQSPSENGGDHWPEDSPLGCNLTGVVGCLVVYNQGKGA